MAVTLIYDDTGEVVPRGAAIYVSNGSGGWKQLVYNGIGGDKIMAYLDPNQPRTLEVLSFDMPIFKNKPHGEKNAA